jgi:hypothetical protein
MQRLDLSIEDGDDTLRFEVERVWIEPYDIDKPCRWDVVIDRLTHWYHTSREWIKKAVLMDDLYVFNNPWSLVSMEKHTSYCAMKHLGMPIPKTWMVPPRDYEPNPDLKPTLQRYAKLFDLGDIGKEVGYPLILKPYDGGGWKAVTRAEDEATLLKAYDESGKLVMHVQKAVFPYTEFVRCVGFGPQLRFVRYDPTAPLHDRYQMDTDFLSAEDESIIADSTLCINSFFGWEFNSCELLRATETGIWHPIDFANACPDSQVTSLHYHFPWLVQAYLRWSIFCAATKRPMRRTLDWDPYYAIAKKDIPYREKLSAYAAIANERFETARFEEFCAKHLGHLDEVTYDYFGSEDARSAVRQKVTALYPQHEVEEFFELFWGRIQRWRAEQSQK